MTIAETTKLTSCCAAKPLKTKRALCRRSQVKRIVMRRYLQASNRLQRRAGFLNELVARIKHVVVLVMDKRPKPT